GIPIPSETPGDFEPSQNIVGRLNALVSRQTDIINGAVSAAKTLVETHRTRVATFNQNFRSSLQDALSKLPTSPIDPDRIVGPGESVFTKSSAATVKTVQETVNSDDPSKRAPARGFISLTADQVAHLKAQVGADGTVPAAAVAA